MVNNTCIYHQVGGLVFQGQLEPTLGTALMFREDNAIPTKKKKTATATPTLPTHSNNTSINSIGKKQFTKSGFDSVFSKLPEKRLKFVDKTQLTVKMKRVFMNKKQTDETVAPTCGSKEAPVNISNVDK